MVIRMLEMIMERFFGRVPEWKLVEAAKNAFVTERLKLDGPELVRRMRAAYPKMDVDIAIEHIEVQLEKDFYRAISQYRRAVGR